jgi:uncharacterized lipoprotein YehR (DUF1307 family)
MRKLVALMFVVALSISVIGCGEKKKEAGGAAAPAPAEEKK